jgi:AcrR family transcriptional regulator
MPKVTQEYKDDQRAQILEAARRCFVRNGFHRTSMQDVFAESGRSAGAVYRYFPKKEDMILAVAAQNLDDVAGLLRTALEDGAGELGPGEVMARLLKGVIQRHADRQLATVALMVWSEALRSPALAERLRAAAATMTDDVAELVRAQQSQGRLTGASAEALAKVVLSILPGSLFEMALLGTDAVTDLPDAARVLLPNRK